MTHWTFEKMLRRLPYVRRLQKQNANLRQENDSLRGKKEMLERWLFPFPQGASQQFSGEIEKFMRFFQPHEVPGFQKRRYGAKADGGYVMLDDFGPVRTAVSLGIGQEDSWDRDITRSFLHPQFFQRHSITPMTLFDPTCFSADGAAIAFPNDVESHYRHGRA